MLFSQAKKASEEFGGSICTRFKSNALPKYELDLFEYLGLTVMHSSTISIFKLPFLRCIVQFHEIIRPKFMSKVILKLFELVLKIRLEINQTCGDLLYDSCLNNAGNFTTVVVSSCASSKGEKSSSNGFD